MDIEQIQTPSSASQSPQRSLWKSVVTNLFVFLILMLIPLSYTTRYTDATLINRIGIIMNFLAGFLLAPDLIGVERLKNSEERIELFMSSINVKSNEYVEWVKGIGNLITEIPYLRLNSLSSFILSCIFILYWYNYGFDIIVKVYIYISFFILIVIFIFGLIFLYAIKRNILLAFLFPIAFLLFSVVDILIRIIVVFSKPIGRFLIVFLRILGITADFTIDKLTGDDRLRSILVYWGIILFIFGNGLQFLATFTV